MAELKTWTIPMTITEKNITDTVICALEGGTDYWMGCDPEVNPWLGKHGGRSFSERFAKGLIAGETAKIFDAEDPETKWAFSLTTLLKGFELYFNDSERALSFEDQDATEADVIFQLGLFNEVRYG